MWDFVKGILGIPKNNVGHDSAFEPELPLWNDNPNHQLEESQPYPFSIFTNPLEIHKYFEKQMDEMLKGMFHFGDSPMRSWQEDFNQPDYEQPQSGNLRDAFLKPGYSEKVRQADEDLDGLINSGDIQRFLEGPPHISAPGDYESMTPSPHQHPPKFSFRSVTVRTVRQPDGSVETIQTVRDHTGREETTVTKQGPSPSPNQPLGGRSLQDDSMLSKFFEF